MKNSQYIIGAIVFIVACILIFKMTQKQKPVVVKENYSSCGYNGQSCFGGKLSVPLPGKSKCFDCEREMIARNGCSIAAGARGNPTLSFDAARQADNMWGIPQYGMPTRSFFADSELIGRTPQYVF
mgnify:CR=1 FL=1